MKIAVAGDSAGEGLAKVLAEHLKGQARSLGGFAVTWRMAPISFTQIFPTAWQMTS